MVKHRSITAIKKGWTDIPKNPDKFGRRFRYTKEKICQTCGLYLKENRKRFCNITCMNDYYMKKTEDINKIR